MPETMTVLLSFQFPHCIGYITLSDNRVPLEN